MCELIFPLFRYRRIEPSLELSAGSNVSNGTTSSLNVFMRCNCQNQMNEKSNPLIEKSSTSLYCNYNIYHGCFYVNIQTVEDLLCALNIIKSNSHNYSSSWRNSNTSHRDETSSIPILPTQPRFLKLISLLSVSIEMQSHQLLFSSSNTTGGIDSLHERQAIVDHTISLLQRLLNCDDSIEFNNIVNNIVNKIQNYTSTIIEEETEEDMISKEIFMLHITQIIEVEVKNYLNEPHSLTTTSYMCANTYQQDILLNNKKGWFCYYIDYIPIISISDYLSYHTKKDMINIQQPAPVAMESHADAVVGKTAERKALQTPSDENDSDGYTTGPSTVSSESTSSRFTNQSTWSQNTSIENNVIIEENEEEEEGDDDKSGEEEEASITPLVVMREYKNNDIMDPKEVSSQTADDNKNNDVVKCLWGVDQDGVNESEEEEDKDAIDILTNEFDRVPSYLKTIPLVRHAYVPMIDTSLYGSPTQVTCRHSTLPLLFQSPVIYDNIMPYFYHRYIQLLENIRDKSEPSDMNSVSYSNSYSDSNSIIHNNFINNFNKSYKLQQDIQYINEQEYYHLSYAIFYMNMIQELLQQQYDGNKETIEQLKLFQENILKYRHYTITNYTSIMMSNIGKLQSVLSEIVLLSTQLHYWIVFGCCGNSVCYEVDMIDIINKVCIIVNESREVLNILHSYMNILMDDCLPSDLYDAGENIIVEGKDLNITMKCNQSFIELTNSLFPLVKLLRVSQCLIHHIDTNSENVRSCCKVLRNIIPYIDNNVKFVLNDKIKNVLNRVNIAIASGRFSEVDAVLEFAKGNALYWSL